MFIYERIVAFCFYLHFTLRPNFFGMLDINSSQLICYLMRIVCVCTTCFADESVTFFSVPQRFYLKVLRAEAIGAEEPLELFADEINTIRVWSEKLGCSCNFWQRTGLLYKRPLTF